MLTLAKQLTLTYIYSILYIDAAVNDCLQYFYPCKDQKMCESCPMDFLKELREQLGLTAYSMAKYLNLQPHTYLYYEREAKGINLRTLVEIKRKLKLSWERLGQYLEREIDTKFSDDLSLEALRKAQRKPKQKQKTKSTDIK
jgi:transcriptional regulator with XRE-family HTH domain